MFSFQDMICFNAEVSDFRMCFPGEMGKFVRDALQLFLGDLREMISFRVLPAMDDTVRTRTIREWDRLWEELGKVQLKEVSLSQLLEESGFFDHLHAKITLFGYSTYFPEFHPFSQPAANIPQLQVGGKWRVAELVQLVERWKANGSEHPLAMDAALRDIRDIPRKEMKSRCFRDLSWVALRVRDIEGRGGRIVRHHTQKGRDKHPTLTGLDRVDWGDGSRWKSVRDNLEPYFEEYCQQIKQLKAADPPLDPSKMPHLPRNSPAMKNLRDAFALTEFASMGKYEYMEEKIRRFLRIYNQEGAERAALQAKGDDAYSRISQLEQQMRMLAAQRNAIFQQEREISAQIEAIKIETRKELQGTHLGRLHQGICY